ncbi:ring-cleaving dioxygenase [Acuticoccus sp. I52.16.1]|uniref:ring-cleaving dioxygenase n=1 Tax=Acuticoccus sp. I52.16.1 TaxID=2928472 RepID=UPI001FD0DE78|nr:ring-cleaving dioxygenase [Acuticoccus sp. I52.16.1]UOM36273.1 ring-cleaving dioxygenase [Acuticoccus sp. I52.16.1]
MTGIVGLHHVTAICGSPQENVDFYVKTMGQRLVKRTVNFDAPGTYHLYYGDAAGSPGTILTFFPFVDAGPGRAGPGMAEAVAYKVAPAGFDAAMERLALGAVDFEGPAERFGARILTLRDPDGMPVEIVEADGAPEAAHAFHSVTLQLSDVEPTARLLSDIFGYRNVGEEADGATTRLRLEAGGEGGSFVDLKRATAGASGRQGAGTIHHVAFRARTNEEQLAWQEKVRAAGFEVTPVIDRQYFNAIYFREPGGVLFEIATDPPGFAVDEAPETLGEALKLPPQYEQHRQRIEDILPPIKVPA